MAVVDCVELLFAAVTEELGFVAFEVCVSWSDDEDVASGLLLTSEFWTVYLCVVVPPLLRFWCVVAVIP